MNDKQQADHSDCTPHRSQISSPKNIRSCRDPRGSADVRMRQTWCMTVNAARTEALYREVAGEITVWGVRKGSG